jgi:hypothetical protein
MEFAHLLITSSKSSIIPPSLCFGKSLDYVLSRLTALLSYEPRYTVESLKNGQQTPQAEKMILPQKKK